MDRQTSGSGAGPSWGGYLVRVQAVPEVAGCLSEVDRAAPGGPDVANGNGWDASAVMQSGETGMSIWESLKKIWSGEVLKEEEERSRHARTDARRAIDETKAMLNGEEMWLIPPHDRTTCDDSK